MFKKPPYGTKISPACAYCTHGSPAADQKMVLCKNRGVVSPYFACRKFRYDPLLRVPHRQELPHGTVCTVNTFRLAQPYLEPIPQKVIARFRVADSLRGRFIL